jgi:Domain of unknown function (DUF6602)
MTGLSVEANSVRAAVDTWATTLNLELAKAREKFAHMGDRGEGGEGAFRWFLREHLSPRFRVGQGEVIDSVGRRSAQTDVIVADEEQPFRVDDNPQLLIIEGVTAAAEVKAKLTTSELADAIEKGRRFKELEAVPGKWTTLASDKSMHGKPNSDLVRFYRHRPFFLFAYESVIADETLTRQLGEAGKPDSLPPLDAVFILSRSFALNVWDGEGAFVFQKLDGQITTGWVWESDTAKALPMLVFWLNAVMPRFSVRSSPLLPYMFATRYEEAARPDRT